MPYCSSSAKIAAAAFGFVATGAIAGAIFAAANNEPLEETALFSGAGALAAALVETPILIYHYVRRGCQRQRFESSITVNSHTTLDSTSQSVYHSFESRESV